MATIIKYVKQGKQPYRCARCKGIIPIGAPRYVHTKMRDHAQFDGSWSICISCDTDMAEKQIERNDQILALYREE